MLKIKITLLLFFFQICLLFCLQIYIRRQQLSHNNEWKLLKPNKLKQLFEFILVMPINKMVWCLVPKVASTSISNAIIEVNNLTSMMNNSYQPQMFLRAIYRNSFLNLLNDTSSNFTSFYISRHPFERLVSAYRNKLENSSTHDWEYFNKIYGHKIVSKFRSKSTMENDVDLQANPHRKEPTFNEFVKYLLTLNVRNFDPHWKPISLLCDICSFPYDYLLRYENFEAEFDALQSYLKKKKMLPDNFSIKWYNRSSSEQDRRKNITLTYMKKLPQNYISSLYNRYRSDFEYYGYSTTDYFES